MPLAVAHRLSIPGVAETRNDMVPSQRQPPLLRDIGEGGYQRRASLPKRRSESTAARPRRFTVRTSVLSSNLLSREIINETVGGYSFADAPYGVDLEQHETQAPGCNC